MKLSFGMKAIVVPAALGLIVGATAFAQQQKKDTASSGTQGTPQDTSRAKDADKATQTNRNQAEHNQADRDDQRLSKDDDFTRTGMYDKYKSHWSARYHDPDFVAFQEQQMKLVAPNSSPNRQGTTTYQQFSEDSAMWDSQERGSEAWQRSDAYWRTSDRYWRNPDRREKNSEDYWKKSEAYWNDSDRYWDSYYHGSNRDNDSVNPSDRTNR